ncbi:MAG TPA: GNAT family N-acetyltransferase [Solirubrobacteraceae bacterium]|nr:GNAT family N-acetyltransferase [Solirubrobacteraceae bacterium]
MDIHALSDGRVVVIRPIRSDDVDRLRAAHGRLSPLSRYRRFMTAKPYLSAADAAYLSIIDGRDHYALVATFADGPEAEEAIIAVARFVRLPRDPAAAEFAIVVGDDWQGEGLGRELMGRLVDAAVAHGVRRFDATMLADNVAIQRLSEQFAAGPLRRVRAGNTFDVEFDLPTRSAHVPAIIAGCVGS